MQNLGLLVFKKEDAAGLAVSLGLNVDPNGRVARGLQVIHCEGCGDELKVSKFGAALPGSTLFYCDDPACLADYVGRKLEKK